MISCLPLFDIQSEICQLADHLYLLMESPHF
jgi:hypothetical protein